MSDNDLIRRGDALALCDQYPYVEGVKTAMHDLPAAQPTVKPGEIESAVWGAMGWALRHAKQMPGDIIPAYTDTGNSDAEVECRRSTTRILSALDIQPTVSPDVAALVEAVIMLNAACDAMWNDHERLEKNPDILGQKYRLKEIHLRAISEAQQNLPPALARVKSKEGFSDEKGVM